MTDRRPQCSAFSEGEIGEIRKIPGMIKLIMGLFVAIVALIFVPFQTVTKLAEQVGELSAIVKERRASALEFQRNNKRRLTALEGKTCLPSKKFYWINRNSREANERLKELEVLLGAVNCSQVSRGADKADDIFPPRSESGLPGR